MPQLELTNSHLTRQYPDSRSIMKYFSIIFNKIFGQPARLARILKNIVQAAIYIILPAPTVKDSTVFDACSKFRDGEHDLCDNPDRAPTWLLRKEMAQAIADCSDPQRNEVVCAIYQAGSGVDLWLLRSSVFQCIATELGQLEAQFRLKKLQPFFAGWSP